MKEYIVTLNNISDKTTFCNEMTASSGSGSIPSRACTCSLMRPSSRNSHFTLTDEEATAGKYYSWDESAYQADNSTGWVLNDSLY